MIFRHPSAEIYIPDGSPVDEALRRTTHLGISAHQDDLEIMAVDGILHCYETVGDWFAGVVLTDGRSSPRSGIFSTFSDDEMMHTRYAEQKRAAIVGNYSAQVLLGYGGADVKRPHQPELMADLVSLLQATHPDVVYTHNLADKHPTHVAAALRVIEAMRQLPRESRPAHVYGCEVWRDLDWMPDQLKVVFDCSSRINLQEALLGVFDSQISGGKRYDLATMGRRLANATYFVPRTGHFESHSTNAATHLAFAMDLTPLVLDESLGIAEYVCGYIQCFEQDVREGIEALMG